MRLLTFIQMASQENEMSFEQIQQELQLKPEEVEGFIIQGREEGEALRIPVLYRKKSIYFIEFKELKTRLKYKASITQLLLPPQC